MNYRPLTLRSEIQRRGRLPVDECVALSLSLARALAHLHAQGLVHRDIKPSNIIFVGGVPKLADIGLVTDMGEARSYVGTAGFIPPEGPGSPAADLFSLGKVLYEASTGKDRHDFPEPLTNLGEQPDKDRLLELNAILHRSCQPDPRARYQSAQEMLAELELLRRGESVKATRVRERQALLAKRILICAAILILLGAGAWDLFQKFHRAETARSSLALRNRLDTHRRSRNAEANILVEQGYSIMNSDTPERLIRSLSCFTNAIRLDPNFTRAYAGLFEVYINDGAAYIGDGSMDQMSRLRSTARKLLDLDDTLPESHYSHSYVQFSSWEFEAALKSVRRALELDPNCAQAHMFLGFYLTHLGQPEEGRQEYARMVELEPTKPNFVRHLGHPDYALRHFDQALAKYQAALDLEPRFTLTHLWIGRCYLAKKEFLKAIDEFESYNLGLGEDLDKTKARLDQLRAAYREHGERGYWLKRRELMETDSSSSPYELAKILSHLVPEDEVFIWLDKAYEKREWQTLEYLLFDECWDPYRSHPRFQDLLKRVGYTK